MRVLVLYKIQNVISQDIQSAEVIMRADVDTTAATTENPTFEKI